MAEPLYRLLAWLSPAYPIGAFSYSHGIETAVEEGFIKDRASLVAWLESVLLQGTGAVDGALFAAAWRAAEAEDWPAFDAIAERAAAWRGTSEMALESRQQGGSFLSITRTAWPHPALDAAHERLGGRTGAAGGRGAGRRRPWHRPGAGPRRLPARLHRQPDLGRAAHRAARPKRRPGGAGGPGRGPCTRRPRRLWSRPRSTRSARRHRCSTGARCATRRSTRGCSAHDPSRRALAGAGRAGRGTCLVGDGRDLAGGQRARRWRAP